MNHSARGWILAFAISAVGVHVNRRFRNGAKRLHFFRRGMERFELRSESDILRGEDRFANGQANRRDGGSVFCEKFDGVRAGYVGHSNGHHALPIASSLLVETDRAGVQTRRCCGEFAAKAYGLAERDRCGLYSALLRGRCGRERCNYEHQ